MPKITWQICGFARRPHDQKEAKQIEKQVAKAYERGARLMDSPVENDEHLCGSE